MQSFDEVAATVRELAAEHFGPVATGSMSQTQFEAELETRIAAIQCTLPSVEECLNDNARYSAAMLALAKQSHDMSRPYLDRKAAKLARHFAILAVMAASQQRAKAQRAA